MVRAFHCNRADNRLKGSRDGDGGRVLGKRRHLNSMDAPLPCDACDQQEYFERHGWGHGRSKVGPTNSRHPVLICAIMESSRKGALTGSPNLSTLERHVLDTRVPWVPYRYRP